MRRFLILSIAAILILGGCANYRNIEITGAEIDRFKLISASEYGVALSVGVDNPSGTDFTIKDACGQVFKDGSVFADIVVNENIDVPAKHYGSVPVKCTVKLRDPMAALVMGLNFKSLDIKQFTVNFTAVVRGGAIKKKVDFKDVPLDKIARYINKEK